MDFNAGSTQNEHPAPSNANPSLQLPFPESTGAGNPSAAPAIPAARQRLPQAAARGPVDSQQDGEISASKEKRWCSPSEYLEEGPRACQIRRANQHYDAPATANCRARAAASQRYFAHQEGTKAVAPPAPRQAGGRNGVDTGNAQESNLTQCMFPHESYPPSCRPTRRDQQPGSLVTHPHRAAWLASRGLKNLTILDPETISNNQRSVTLQVAEEAEAVPMDVTDERARPIENPFNSLTLKKLLSASRSARALYQREVDCGASVLSAAVALNRHLTPEQLQHIVNAAANILIACTPRAELELPSAGPEASFIDRAVRIFEDILEGLERMQPDDTSPRGFGRNAARLLQQQSKCAAIVELLLLLEKKEEWPYAVLRYFVFDLWMVPTEQLDAHYAYLLPIYEEGRFRSTMPIAQLEAELDLTLERFEKVHKIAILFLVPEDNMQLIKELIPFPPTRQMS